MRNKILNILTVICIAVLAVSGWKIGDFLYQKYKSEKSGNEIKEVAKKSAATSEPSEPGRWVPTKATFEDLHARNSDYVGWLLWDSDLISEPLLQGVSNNSYIRSNFDGQYDIWGSIFVDSNASLDADNIPIYGHSLTGVKSDRTKFSQLQNMTDQGFCDANSTFKIYWEDHISSYKIFSTMLIDTSTDDWAYQQTAFGSDESKLEWIKAAEDRSAVSSNVKPTEHDKFVTFQTCHDDYSAVRYVIVAVQTGTEEYAN